MEARGRLPPTTSTLDPLPHRATHSGVEDDLCEIGRLNPGARMTHVKSGGSAMPQSIRFLSQHSPLTLFKRLLPTQKGICKQLRIVRPTQSYYILRVKF